MITVVHAGPMIYIGEWHEVTRILKNPRVLVNRQVSATEVNVILQKMIGDPAEIAICTPITVTYEPRDKNLVDYYRSEVSGIQLVPASAMPKVKQ